MKPFVTTLVVIGTDCTGSCKFNYHTIMTMTAPTSAGDPPLWQIPLAVKTQVNVVSSSQKVSYMKNGISDIASGSGLVKK
jgi:hypothetical protein